MAVERSCFAIRGVFETEEAIHFIGAKILRHFNGDCLRIVYLYKAATTSANMSSKASKNVRKVVTAPSTPAKTSPVIISTPVPKAAVDAPAIVPQELEVRLCDAKTLLLQ